MVRWSWRMMSLIGGAALAAAALTTAWAQTPGATVRLDGPTGELPSGTKTFDVQVMADNVQNLGGFQFILNFDPAILSATGAEVAPFLGSSGREVLCGDPTIADGALRLSCVTLRQQPDGVTGSGPLATVHLTVNKSGPTDLTLDRVQLNTPKADPIAISSISGSSVVGNLPAGTNWVLWGTVIGVVAAVVAVAAGASYYLLVARRASQSKSPATLA